MMLVRGALVVLLTCLALASSQRKVSRTTQVTEEIKPEINFQCPEEFGYYPHPSDCTLYHVCFFGRPVLESCTGGLMYSPELQTCDWPRNVGCDGTGEISLTSVVSSSNPPSSSSISSEPRTRYTASSKSSSSSISSQPSVIVTPRGQPRSLHHTQEIVKQQRYYDQDEEIPEQIAVVERQRTYRGQPAKVSDVQRDRDGLSPYGDNSIPSYSSRGEKISVISFGTSQQSNPSYSKTDINDVITNDLKLRRRKRQIPRSNHDVTPWHGSSSVKRSYQSIRNPSVVLLQPPTPTPTLQYNSNFHTQFLSIPQQESGFKPYFPNYDNYNVNPVFQEDESKQYKPPQVKQKEDYYYINPSGGITPKPATITQGRVVFLDNSKPVNQNTQVVFKQKPLKQESKTSATIVNFSLIHDNKPSDNKATSKNLPYHHHEDYKYPGNDDYGDYNSKDGERYYNSRIPDLLPYQKNNYENINPFSSDDFNVDEFFKGFDHFYGPERDATTTEVVPTNIPKSNLERTTEKVRTTTLNDYYYYDDYDEVTEKAKIKYTTTKQPERREKFGTSTIQSVAYGKKTKPKDEQYYYDEYDYDSESVAPTLAPVTEVPKPIRITTEPTTSTTQKLTTTTSPSTISYKIISSTTPSPVYTIRQRIRTTTLRTTNRPVHIDNRQKVLTTTDSDVNLRPDDLTTSRVEEASITPQKTVTTATNKALYNGTRHYESTHYDPYYIYDDVELYRDIEDYPQHYNSNNGGRQHTQSTYRGTPASSVQVLPTSEEVPKRKPAFQEHTYLPQDVYQPTVSEYNDGYVDDQSAYIRQSNRQSTNLRGDRNDINYIEEPTTTKRTTTTSTTTTTTTTPRPIPSQKSTVPSRTNTRGRGNLHYSTGGNGDAITVNRGTPPPRTRSTLKPSTSIVSKAAEFVDIYKYPPRRPDTIYPQPVPDKAAAKCRRDVCLLPDCSCGGKEIPGDVPVEQVPQIVLLTFDDSVNDLNKGLYSELFERGRVNPNGCPIAATFYVSHEWTDYSQVQNLYSDGHEIASHTVSHSFGEQFSQKKWTKEVAGQREILAAYGGVKLEDVRGMRAPFLSVGGNKMFKMLYDSNFTFDSSMPIYENKPPSWPYTLDYKLFHDCMIPPCPTRSYPGVWEVPMVMWQDLNGGRCSMGDACSHPADADGVVKLLKKNFQRHYTTNRAPFGLFYHAAYFTKDHHKEGFIKFLDYINSMKDVYLVTNWQAIQWVRDPTPLSRLSNFQPFHCNYSDRPKRCNNPKVCNLWHKSGVRYMRTCQPCPDIYPWTGNTGIRSSRIDNDIED